MHVQVIVDDVLSVAADALICPANPWLNLSGGISGEILRRGGGEIQAELHAYLANSNLRAVPAGTVVATSAGELPFNLIIHAVAIDPFYESSSTLVGETLRAAFTLAIRKGAESVSVPALATGYGRLAFEEFASAAAAIAGRDWAALTQVQFVVKTSENAEILRRALTSSGGCGFSEG